MSVPSNSGPVPILAVLAMLIIVLTVLGMKATDLHVILIELSSLVTGYALGKAQPPVSPT